MRYRVIPAAHNLHGFHVGDSLNPCRDLIAQHVEKAEAEIIAWALNAVAEGYILGKAKRLSADYTDYDGPTEGVAP